MHQLVRRVVAILVSMAVLAPPLGATPAVHPCGERTVAESGRTRIIAFTIDTPLPEDHEFPWSVDPPTSLTVIRPPVVLAGETTGYLRIRGETPGTTTLHVGDGSQVVDVVPARHHDHLDPTLVGPADGAAVWGVVRASIEVLIGDRPAPTRIELHHGDDVLLSHDVTAGDVHRPYCAIDFDLDASMLDGAAAPVTPVVIDAAGHAWRGTTSVLRVLDGAEMPTIAGEAETVVEVERPQRFRDDRMSVGWHLGASGGRYFGNAGAYPALCIPAAIDRPGWYQLVVVASGTSAQGALPTIGVVVDGENEPRTNGRLLSTEWHRLAIGVPFPLDAGAHVITPFFENDFYVPNVADRNLRIDRYEIRRVADAGGPADGAGADMGGMAMGMGMVAMAGGAEMAGAGGAEFRLDDPYAFDAAPARIAFNSVYDGRDAPGMIEIAGRVWWRDERAPAPEVTLTVNDRTIGRQRAAAPTFWVDALHLRPGLNTIRLDAHLADGRIVSTPVQTLHRPQVEGEQHELAPRRFARFTMHDDGWDEATRARRSAAHGPAERRAATFASAGTAELTLPNGLSGRYVISVETLGEHFEGPPVVAVALRTPDGDAPIGEFESPTWWDLRSPGEVDLAVGPKSLLITFTNDRYEPGKGDRNLHLQSVILQERAGRVDRVPPLVELLYPPDPHEAWRVDAVVARVADDIAAVRAELVVDGVRTGETADLRLRAGPIVLPLLLRGLEPGVHEVVVETTDLVGNVSRSAPSHVTVLDRAPDAAGPYARAVHLLNRLGYGPDPTALAAVLVRGERAWLHDQLTASFDADGDRAALGTGLVHFAEPNQYTVPRRALAHLALTPNPVRARFVLWAENHFSTWIRKVDAVRKWDEHIRFSRAGVAPFDRLLELSATSPAMLNYLDQDVSFAGGLNENYAREVLELHTLGVDGGYTQADVTHLAALLTGWTAATEGDGRNGGQQARTYTYRFDAALNEADATTVLGLRFDAARRAERYDRVRAAFELLAAHPSTARFIATSLAEHYVAVPAPAALVDRLATVYVETGGDMVAMMTALVNHDSFWSSADTPRLQPPIDYAVRLMRTTGSFQPWQGGDFLQRSGTGLFDRATPDGYPDDDEAYADSNAMIQRWRLARQMEWPLVSLVPGPWRWDQAGPDDDWAQRVIDIIAVRLTGAVLGAQSNEAALTLARELDGPRDVRARTLAPFIAQLPEASRR